MSRKCTNHWKHLETLKAWFRLRPVLQRNSMNSMPLATAPFVFNRHILVFHPPYFDWFLTQRQSPGPHHSSAQAQYHLSTSGSTRSGFGLWHLKWKHLSLTPGMQTLPWLRKVARLKQGIPAMGGSMLLNYPFVMSQRLDHGWFSTASSWLCKHIVNSCIG